MKKIEPIKNPQRIFNYWAKEKTALFLAAISGTLYNVGMLASPICQGMLIDALANYESFTEIFNKAFLFMAAIVVVMIFRYIKRFYVRRFANNTNATMRLIIYNNLVNKNERELSEKDTGALMSKVIADV
ncbi:MAG: ABC transporter ATP-binding protein, partial [Oscillospiraceae bacterium]